MILEDEKFAMTHKEWELGKLSDELFENLDDNPSVDLRKLNVTHLMMKRMQLTLIMLYSMITLTQFQIWFVLIVEETSLKISVKLSV